METEYRVARSASNDKTFNTLDLQRALSFAVLEFLDPTDSQFFSQKLRAKKWNEVTPERMRKRRTYAESPAPADELAELAEISPDWLYISGHYGRTYAVGDETRTLLALPAGLFNEPFHINEWESAWSKPSSKSAYLQMEQFVDDDARSVFEAYMARRTLFANNKFRFNDTRPTAQLAAEWANAWEKPNEEIVVSGQTYPASRGFLLSQSWDEVKVVLLICCNTIVWGKSALRDAFPSAVFLGYLGKNPSNATPHVRAFLQNAFRNVNDPSDPILLDHEHLIKAWLDVHHKQQAFQSEQLACFLPDGRVLRTGRPDAPEAIGHVEDILIPLGKGGVRQNSSETDLAEVFWLPKYML